MNKYIKLLSISILACFSFYYTNQIINYFDNKNPILIKIKEQENKNILPINAEINDNTIKAEYIGKKIDKKQSFKKMQTLNEYNENLLVFINDYPDIRIKNNFNKFIINGNNIDKYIYLVFDTENINNIYMINTILKESNISSNIFINNNAVNNKIIKLLSQNNYIGNNNVSDLKNTNKIIENYTSYEVMFCLSTNKDIKILNKCSNNKMYTINPIIVSETSPYSFIKNNLSNGNIYYLKCNEYTIKELNIIIKYIKQKGYEFKTLNELIDV